MRTKHWHVTGNVRTLSHTHGWKLYTSFRRNTFLIYHANTNPSMQRYNKEIPEIENNLAFWCLERILENFKKANFMRKSQFLIPCSFSLYYLRHSWHTYKNQNMHVNDLYVMQWVVLRVAFSIILSRMWTSNFIPITRKSSLIREWKYGKENVWMWNRNVN